MAGKTKKQGGTPRTPKAVGMPNPSQLGHLALKSSPYAPTDCKLTSQHMIRDRMTAHYKKLNKAKAAVDTGPPKAWLVSQKMRDRARREASKNDPKYTGGMRPMSARARSLQDLDRTDMLAMMENLSYDETDYYDTRYMDRPHTSMELNVPESDQNGQDSDMQLVNRIVNDTEMSPSRYLTNKSYKSNIPPPTQSRAKSPAMSYTRVIAQKPLYKTQILETYTPRRQSYAANTSLTNSNAGQNYYQDSVPIVRTPRSGDVIEKHSERFTEGKPFQPRTLKSNRTSKLSQFKYYNAPKRQDGMEEDNNHDQVGFRPESMMSGKMSMRTSMRSRPGTANTDDMWNETIVSRDFNDRPTPTGVPSLDISMDQDNIKWLQEQSHKAKIRSTSARYEDPNTTKDMMNTTTGMNSTLGKTAGTYTMNGTMDQNVGYSGHLNTTRELADEEEELQYLEFVQDVTSDVLDRGIFTNRMLKQVFQTHVIRRRHILNEDKMREKLEDLRIELGIPEDHEDDTGGLGLTSTHSHSRANRRSRQEQSELMSTTIVQKKAMPSLHSRAPMKSPRSREVRDGRSPSPGNRSPSPGGKPPLPRPGSRGNRTLDQTTSSLEKTQDLNTTKGDDDSVFGTVTRTNTTGGSADILKVEHEEDDELEETMEPDINGNEADEVEDTLLYQQHLQASLDNSDSELSDTPRAEDTDRPVDTQRTDHTDGTQGGGGYTDRTETEGADSVHGGYTERTNSHRSGGYSDGFESERSTDRHEMRQASPNESKQKLSARQRRRNTDDSMRSHDHTNTTTSYSEVSELEDNKDDDDDF